jgi:hypothetical protein
MTTPTELFEGNTLKCPKCESPNAAIEVVRVVPSLPHSVGLQEVSLDPISGSSQMDFGGNVAFQPLRESSRPFPSVTLVGVCENDCRFMVRFAFSALEMATAVKVTVEAS